MIDIKQNLLLGVKMHELVLLKYFLLPHDFEGVDLSLALEADEFDPAEGAVAEGADHLQVIFLQLP